VDYTVADYWRDHNRSFARLSSYRDGLGVLVLDGQAEMLRGLRVSYDFFDTLGVKMELGRTFRREEDQPNQRPAIILSYDFWVRRFGADPHIIGRVLQLDTFRPVVVGVLPRRFEPLLKASSELTPEMYVSLSLGPGVTCCRAVRVVGRLKPGATMVQARDELTALTQNLAQQSGVANWQQADATVIPLPEGLLGRFAAPLWATWMAAVFILLIACANVANLVLARGASRTKEMAARAALGASRGRIAAQLLTENLLLSLAGSLTGILLAFACTPLLISLAPPQMLRVQHTRMDAWVLAFGLAAGVFTSLLFGLAPVLRLSRVDLNQTLKTAGNADGHSPRAQFHYRFGAAELALAFVLVTGATLMLKSFVRLQKVDLGFDPHNVLTLTTQGPARLEQVLDRIRAMPGVESAAFTTTIPMDQIDRRPLLIEGRAVEDPAQAPLIEVATVSPDFFRVMRIPLKRGRLFADDDSPGGPRVVLISESCARTQFAGEDPIGKHIMLGEIVGVVGDVRLDRPDLAPAMQVYASQTQNPNGIFRLVARTMGDPLRMEGAIRNAFLSVDKMQVVYHVKSLEDYVAGTVAERSFSSVLRV
jgi:putative ABC transport system permease protein